MVAIVKTLQNQPVIESSRNLYRDQLITRLKNNTAKIAVIGMGYVGLPLSVCVAKVGLTVYGLDVNLNRVEQINQGQSYINDVTSAELTQLVHEEKIHASSDFSLLAEADVVVICVPTPLTKNQTPDISYIEATAHQIAKYVRPGQLITLESTTYPGTTEDVLLPTISGSGLKVGEDFFLAHSPERVDPGNERYNTHNTNKIVGGLTEACREVAAEFYRKSILDVILVSSPGCAEMVKVFENTFRAVNIALVNELALLCDKMNLNIWEVVEAAGTKPFGMMTFWPGPGVGGHCIPIDPFYLTWKAREYKFHTRFIELAGEINSYMPQFVREKVLRALGKLGKPLYGANVLILGMAYKKDLGDWRDSPAVDLYRILKADHVNVHYNDPFVPELSIDNQTLHSLPINQETLAQMDCVVVVTNHSIYDCDFIAEHSNMIVDTRNAFKNVLDQREKIILL